LIDLQISGGKNSPGSFSRSAVNYNAGVYTTVSNIVMSLVVMVVLLALTPLFADTPNTILAAIIIAAVVSLINVRAAYLIWKVDKFDFIALLGAFFGTLFISVEIGLLIAVSKASTLPPNQCSLHHC
jgi:high affinity sulfate transporter 1